jgi:hypothetical protein
MTLAVPIDADTEARLASKARAAGMDVVTFVAQLVEREARRVTVRELSGEVAENFRKTGMSEEEMGELLEREKHAAREKRRGRAFGE